ncbi:mandelate racemase/muconate lactonizing enzyme family protein [Paenibacillus wynnii]|uniref:Isomerase n=1 Tax=Paenibacillus wynnii TaxID=268407 RepID=A0A098M7Z9_9BACL|nr:mandelate racemase/muconate lactonizing enzyme family protein [Paenibacillus wynnii]KGE18704.1 isomerase [Paenibacillus wynnii]
MNIARVDTFPLYYPLKQPYGDANGYKNYRSNFLFRITTQSGIIGWGECVDWLPALKAGFEGKIIPYLIGKQALNRVQLVNHIKQWHQRAASGVSMALTEIAAKYSGLSVCELWGGSWRDSVPVYASFQSYSYQTDWVKHSLDLVKKSVISGFTQIKVKVGGKPFKEDQSHIQKLQGLLSGSCEMILDANQSYDFSSAREWEKDFSKWDNILWFEEPLPMNRVGDYKMLRTILSVPIAGGENLRNSEEFLPLLREGAIDITQPDPAHEAGIDDYRHTLFISRLFGLRTSPHTFDGGLSRLYALFAQACLPPWSKMENKEIEPVEWDVMDNPLTSITPIEAVGGKVKLPIGVGIGMELDEEILKRYRWDGSVY